MLINSNNIEPYKKTKLFIIFILYLSACVETDLLLPALPNIMNYFAINGSYVQKIFSINFIAIAISGFLLGTISDFLGRKKIIVFSLVIFLVGSLLTLFAENFNFFLVGRFIQGIGAGGMFSLGMAMIGDFFPGDRSIVARSVINSIMPLLISLMPIIGKFINQYYGFQGICSIISMVAFISLCLNVIFLKKILIPVNYNHFQFQEVLKNYKTIASSINFWLLNCKISLLSAGYLAFNTQIAILFMVKFKMQAGLFCYFQISILFTYILGNLFGNFLIKNFSVRLVKNFGITLVFIGAICLFMISWLFPTMPSWIVFSMLIYIVGYVILQMLFFSELLNIYPKKRGTIASLRTSSRLLITTLVLEIVASNYNDTIMPIAILELIISLLVGGMMLYHHKIMTRNYVVSQGQNQILLS